MRATTLIAPREIVETDLPEPAPGPGQVVVRPFAVGICGSDLSAFRGTHPRMVPPLVMGHEFAGQIVEVGRGVPSDMVGRRVAVDPLISCGVCEACAGGRPNVCDQYRVLGCRPGLIGAFAEGVVVEADKVWELPADCSYLVGAMIQPLAISHHAVAHRARASAGDDVLIIGAGPVGLGAMMMASARKAVTTVVDVDPYRLDIAEQMGADRVLLVEDRTHMTELRLPTRPAIVLECVGGRQTETLAAAMTWCRPGGRVVIVGNFAARLGGLDPVSIKTGELEIVGSQGYVGSFAEVVQLLGDGGVEPKGLISHVLPLETPDVGLRILDDPTVVKSKIIMAEDDGGVGADSLP